MTEEEIKNIEKEIEDYNKEREKEALAEFRNSSVPDMKWFMEHLLNSLLDSIAELKSGKVSDEWLGPFELDELTRLLSTRTFVSYEGLSLEDRSMAEDADSDASIEEVASDCTITSWTPEFGLWRKVVTALEEYLYAAAVIAKSVNAASTAARLYLRAWRIVKRIKNRDDGYSCATQDEALAIMRLERVASDRLFIDAQFAALPPFKKAKKPRQGKSKKAKKAK